MLSHRLAHNNLKHHDLSLICVDCWELWRFVIESNYRGDLYLIRVVDAIFAILTWILSQIIEPVQNLVFGWSHRLFS